MCLCLLGLFLTSIVRINLFMCSPTIYALLLVPSIDFQSSVPRTALSMLYISTEL